MSSFLLHLYYIYRFADLIIFKHLTIIIYFKGPARSGVKFSTTDHRCGASSAFAQ